ncbi:unnamed protein product [Phytophthora fragariaefolia]|uniref:Unnamed protein product n=1 Tax=Phytophthora fragariaefolia TaxID=1490495 RepID=A0A9W6XRC5_9STRA|nr:unnamed protein product [Phytophthora fragariaefolia]
MDHPESMPDGQSSNKQPGQDKTCDGSPGIHSYVNRIFDEVAERAGVSERLTSHSFRRGASVGLETAQYNVNGRILDTLMAYLLRHYPCGIKLNPNGLSIQRLEACAVEKGFTVNALLSWSSHLACDPNKASAAKPGENQEPATGITQNPLFCHQAALIEHLVEVNQKLDAHMTTMEDAFYSRQ